MTASDGRRSDDRTPLLVVLHGYEDEPGRRLDATAVEGWRVITPRGPIELPGGPAWFASDDDGPVTTHLISSLDGLDELIRRERRGAVVVGGYSQGGAVALAWALREAGRDDAPAPDGVFCVNAWLPHDDALAYDLDRLVAARTRVLVVASAADEVVAVQSGRSAARVLERGGVDVTYVELAGGHQAGAEATAALHDWLATLPDT